MRKALVFATALGLFISATCGQAATVIDFEDLDTRDSFGGAGGLENWDTYQGFIWGYGTAGGVASRSFTGGLTGWASATVSDPAYGLPPANVSGTAYAWNYNGPQSLWINFQTALDVTSLDLATLSPRYLVNSLTVQVFGYDAANNLIGFTGPFALTDSFQTFAANLNGAYYLELRSNADHSWFSIDNLTFNVSAVPEPGTWAMMLIGFGAVGFTMRRKRRTDKLVQPA